MCVGVCVFGGAGGGSVFHDMEELNMKRKKITVNKYKCFSNVFMFILIIQKKISSFIFQVAAHKKPFFSTQTAAFKGSV